MKKIITPLSLMLMNTLIFSIDEVSLLGTCGSTRITQEICDNLADLKTYEILGMTNEVTKIIKKTTEKRAKKHCINTDYPLSLAELKQARNNAIKELNKIQTYENEQPNSYKSMIDSYKKVIGGYDKAIQEISDREKMPEKILKRVEDAIRRAFKNVHSEDELRFLVCHFNLDL